MTADQASAAHSILKETTRPHNRPRIGLFPQLQALGRLFILDIEQVLLAVHASEECRVNAS